MENPLDRMLDRTEGHAIRWAAAEQAEREMFDHPDRVRALQRLVVEPGHPVEYGTYAIEQLLRIDAEAAKAFLKEAIVRIGHWPVLEYLCQKAVEEGWSDFTAALVRSYAIPTRRVGDAQRPERKALEHLNPDVPVEETIWHVFADSNLDVRSRVAAWALLHRLQSDTQAIHGRLATLPAGDALTDDLRAGSAELCVVADSIESVTWLKVLRSDLGGSFWSEARKIVGRLSREQRQGMELRHLPVLIYCDKNQPESLRLSRSTLLNELRGSLIAQTHHLKPPPHQYARETPQTLGDFADTLAWADLLTVRVMVQAMRDRRIVAAWFEQADADLLDKSSEHGGLLRIGTDGRLVPQHYTAMAHRHDRIYLSPPQLLLDAYTAPAHYHFHAQEHDNAALASPGRGDMDNIARRQRLNGLVLTFISRNELNVDLYFAPDVIVDLGTVSR